MNKLFRVATVSANANSFGLRGVVLIAQDGQVFEVGSNRHNLPAQGAELRVPLVGKTPVFAALGFEIPRELNPPAPPEVLALVWPPTT